MMEWWHGVGDFRVQTTPAVACLAFINENSLSRSTNKTLIDYAPCHPHILTYPGQ